MHVYRNCVSECLCVEETDIITFVNCGVAVRHCLSVVMRDSLDTAPGSFGGCGGQCV